MSETKNLIIIQDPSSKNPVNLSILLKKAASKLDDIAAEYHKTVEITSLQLLTPLTSDDIYSLDINYWFNTKAYLKHTKESVEWSKTYKVTEDTLPIEIIGSSDLACMTVRMPQGEEQWDSIKLLNFAASEIAQVKDAKIIDCIYHGYIDSDAIDHPFLNIYYRY